MKFFICYAREDDERGFVSDIVTALRRSDHDVFIDQNIDPGDDWAERIEEELISSEIFVCVLSMQSAKNAFVRTEILSAAKARGRNRNRNPRIIPVYLNDPEGLPLDVVSVIDPLQRIEVEGLAAGSSIATRILQAAESRLRLNLDRHMHDPTEQVVSKPRFHHRTVVPHTTIFNREGTLEMSKILP